MRVSLEWLRDYIDIEMTDSELADALSMSGTAVDRVLTLGGGVTGVVAAEVLEVKPHPGADSLMLAVVNDGTSVHEIVCGAPNLRAGMKSPMARVGATLPAVSAKPLKKAKIRGVESVGMLLAGDELGISEDHTGILELAPDTVVGTDVGDLLVLEDVVFELEITPNRPDCMSMIGVAREVSALTGKPVKMPATDLAESGPPIDGLAKVMLEDPAGCPRYTARALTGVSIAPSPPWMQRRLTAAGLRPISNVVDVTNYVLLEVGQPLHAFDLDLLSEQTIIVRKAGRGEPIKTLDGVDRQLDDRAVVIADASEPVALAGIIGGEDSEVKDSSTNILIESAHFDPTSILLTSKRLGVRTEASARFERGVDPNGTSFAAARAARLMNELAGGAIAMGEIDEYPEQIVPVKLELRAARTDRVLGTDLEPARQASILKSLDMSVSGEETMEVIVPTFRRDLEREIDLIEEVARIFGYGEIPTTLPRGGGMAAGLTAQQSVQACLIDSLIAEGLSQAVTFSFMRPGDLDLLELDASDNRRRTVSILNPVADTGEVLRTTLLPGLLRAAAGNINRGNRDLALFEAGRAFIARGEGELPYEVEAVALLQCGSLFPATWSRPDAPVDYFDLKGVLENVAETLGLEAPQFAPRIEPFLAPGRAASVLIDGKDAGYVGLLHPRVAAAFDLEGEFYICEFEVRLLTEAVLPRVYSPVGRFPNVKVDIAAIVEEGTAASTVEEVIRKNAGRYLKSVRLFDLYRGPQVGDGKKSLAYALEFGSAEGTLTDEQAHSEMDRIIGAIERELGASIRGREREGGAT